MRGRWRFLLCSTLLASRVWAQGPSPVTPPVVEHRHEAVYPPSQLPEHRHAEVVLIVTIDPEGRVHDVQIAQSGGKDFDDAAAFAVRLWRFAPAKRGGKSVSARIRVPFRFAPPEEPATEEVVAPEEPGAVVPPEAAPKHTHPSEPPQPPKTHVEDIRVVGRSYMPSRGTSDYDITVGKLAAVPRTDAASYLRLAPGMFLTNPGGTGHPYQIFLRGFDAREGQDIEFTVDGIPINEVGNPHGNGMADTHFIIPELVQRLRVLEGPFAPQQGNFAVAGSALYDVGVEKTGLTLAATAGSFNTKRGLLMWRPQGFSERTFGAAEVFSSDGFGQNRASDRVSAMGGFETNIGAKGSLRLLASSYATHYAQAGVLRRDDVEAGRQDFFGTYDTAQGGDSVRHSIGATFTDRIDDARVMQSFFVTVRDFRLRQNFTGFQEDVQETWQSSHEQRGDLIDQQASTTTVGARGSARQGWKLFGERQELELGYFARFDDVAGQQRRLRGQTTVPYRKNLELDSTLTNVGMYADASVRPLSWITVRGGGRVDVYHYRVSDRCAVPEQTSFGGDPLDTECFSSDRVGYRSPDQTTTTSASLFQPRAAVLFGPFRGFTPSVSYGKGSRSVDPQYVNQGLETPFAEVSALEGGVSYVRPLGDIELTARSVFFQTDVDKDLFFNQVEGRNTLSTGTRRSGWAGNARLTGDFFDLATSLTLVRATFNDTHLAIPYAPAVVSRADGVLFADLPVAIEGRKIYGSLGFGASYVGPRPLPFNEKSSDIFLVDAAAQLRWKALSFGLTCTNLFDRRYRIAEYNYASDFRSQGYATRVPARHFVAGEPRAVFGTLTLTLDGAGS